MGDDADKSASGFQPETDPLAEDASPESAVAGGSDDGIISCPDCSYASQSQHCFNVHVRRNHTPGGRTQCPKCPWTTVHAYRLEAHLIRAHNLDDDGPAEKDLYPCDKCGHRATNREALRQHLIKHHSEVIKKAHQCDHCPYSTSVKQYLSQHVARIHADRRVCKNCGWSTGYPNRLARHLENCSAGNKAADNKANKAKKDVLDEDIVQCDYCEYSSSSKRNLYQHVQRNHTERKVCKGCGWSTGFADRLTKHLKNCSAGKEALEKEANESEKKDADDENVADEREVGNSDVDTTPTETARDEETTEDPNPAEIANETEPRDANDDAKKESGSEEEGGVSVVIACKQCDSVFESYKRLATHAWDAHRIYVKQPGFRRRPKGDRERTHKCHLCDYSTAYKFNLTKHINGTHLNIKHEKCDECDYVTSYSSLLKSHKIRYHSKGTADGTIKLTNIRRKKTQSTTKSNRSAETRASSEEEEEEEASSSGDDEGEEATRVASDGEDSDASGDSLKCSDCDHVAETENALAVHEYFWHPPVPLCESCGFRAESETEMFEHRRDLHAESFEFGCEECTFSAWEEVLLREHVNKEHS